MKPRVRQWIVLGVRSQPVADVIIVFRRYRPC
jgi:hypothetical protein